MVSKEPVRIRISTDHDALAALDAVEADKVPRVIVRNGEAVAAIVSMGDFERLGLASPSREARTRALGALGGWKVLGGDDLTDRIYDLRHDTPERPPFGT
jgi:PHD/YefM family antitoxin component YafN of YafNO toxin-antitoxin module